MKPQKQHGLSVRAHMGQLSETVLSPFLRFNPASFDHMDHVSEDDIAQLAKRDTVATLVPGANYFLGLKEYPNARRLIDAGVPVASGDGLQSRHLADDQHADGDVAGLHAHEDVAGGSNRGGHNQRSVGSCAWRTERAASSRGKTLISRYLPSKDYREIPYWFGANHCAMTVLNGVVASRAVNFREINIRITNWSESRLRLRDDSIRIIPIRMRSNPIQSPEENL